LVPGSGKVDREDSLFGLNHIFQTAASGELSDVAAIEETMSPRALEMIGAWATRQARK
jgi:hypothetical protein